MTELLYRVALTKIPKVGAIISKNLISYCGSAEAVFKAKKRDLMSVPNVGEAIADNIIKQDVLTWAEKELAFLEKHAIQPLTYNDPHFPQRLKVAHDCPALLYYKGTTDLNHGRVVGIVGTRKPTAYGTRMTELFTEGLAQYNVLVVSGLAFGVDVAAHRKCVDMKMPTVGVMGTGMQKLYPSEHRDVARRMCENGGLLTEYPSDQEPDREHFPMRNRIIAGMCDALVVIESAKSGGSMITAHMALGYEKEVYAIPGRVGDKTSEGCNYLIKSNKAALIESADDFAEMMRWDELDKTKSIQTQLFTELTDNEQVVMKILQQSDGGAMIDALSYQTQLNHSAIASLLLTLEFKGLIRSLPGKRYALA
jgi:DNA processing protein